MTGAILVRASFARKNCYATQASLYLQRSSGFLFNVKFARKVFTNYLFLLHPDF